jgi:hypothetical protein
MNINRNYISIIFVFCSIFLFNFDLYTSGKGDVDLSVVEDSNSDDENEYSSIDDAIEADEKECDSNQTGKEARKQTSEKDEDTYLESDW